LTADGKPDLDKVQAFIAMGNQGIVYEANRWHSPMCAIDQVHSSSSRLTIDGGVCCRAERKWRSRGGLCRILFKRQGEVGHHSRSGEKQVITASPLAAQDLLNINICTALKYETIGRLRRHKLYIY
jgi:Ureidoglycolate lyase